MDSWQPLVMLAVLAGGFLPAYGGEFSGAEALGFTKRVVDFGPRPSGSPEIQKLQLYILGELKSLGCNAIQDDFTASTPLGRTPMKNILVRFPGTSGKAEVFTGHYDTKSMPGSYFVGANDGGSSAGLLLEMAKALAEKPGKMTSIWSGSTAKRPSRVGPSMTASMAAAIWQKSGRLTGRSDAFGR